MFHIGHGKIEHEYTDYYHYSVWICILCFRFSLDYFPPYGGIKMR